MQESDLPRAVAAARAVAAEAGLVADDVTVLQHANRLVVRLRPCDSVARIAPLQHQAGAAFEVELARHLAAAGSPVATLDPRVPPGVAVRDGFAVTLWTAYDLAPQAAAPAEYAQALARLHAGMREIHAATPHFTDRVAEALGLVESPAHSPDLAAADRELLSATLRRLRRVAAARPDSEQLLHGEPHPGNLLLTPLGPLFVDLETCCRGPVEFDLAHAPEAVGEHYPGADQALLRACRILARAIVAAWRWDRDDVFPNGRQMGIDLVGEIRAAMADAGPDAE